MCDSFYLKVNIDFNVKIPDISGVWFESEDAIDLLPLGAGEVVLQVEDSLLPVGVGGFWGGGESNSLVAVGELHVEKCHQGLETSQLTY